MKYTAFWTRSLCDLFLGDQNSEECMVILLHAPGEAEQCIDYGTRIDKDYNVKDSH
jgi:hypothetical protein